MRLMLLAAAAALTCHGAPPHSGCQCLCALTAARPAGLIYMCTKKIWYCPRPAAPKKSHRGRPLHGKGS